MEQETGLNEHNKADDPRMHSAEHILNQTMIRLYHCGRSKSTHIEKKKSKCDYPLAQAPSADEVQHIEDCVNQVIDQQLPITAMIMQRSELPQEIDLSKLPSCAGDTLRVVFIGDYDACACIGAHVDNTKEIGHFKIISSDYNENGIFRIRFKLL